MAIKEENMQKLYKIGEVSELTSLPIKTLRYYEELKLIKPAFVDAYTGYRNYSEQNIVELYKIKSLKELGFSLQEIKDYNDSSLLEKEKQLKTEIECLYKKLRVLSSYNNQKGENFMKPFINDENAIGKWKYAATAVSEDAYEKGEQVKDRNLQLDELYFLQNGEGYWIFDRWTKGYIFRLNGSVYTYKIKNNLLYLHICDKNGNQEQLMVYKKVDSKKRTLDDIAVRDNIDLPFVADKRVLGYWQVVDFINREEYEGYAPKVNPSKLWVKSATFLPTGELIMQFNNNKMTPQRYTKGFIIDKHNLTASKYIVKSFNGDKFMFAEWKSGDYIFGGYKPDYYVYKLVK